MIERLFTGVSGLDEILEGGVPRGFFIAVTGEPGTGKTILCIHFINCGVLNDDKCIYVTTEESRESIIRQAEQFGFNFSNYVDEGRLIIIDALMGKEDKWSLSTLTIDELVNKVLEAKRSLGYGRARLVIDSMSAFWLDKPAMARRYAYFVKKVLYKWDFTIFATSQYAITTSEAFGWGLEHVADGIIRFRRFIRNGLLRRYIIVEKMRQTQHSLNLHEINIESGKGLMILSRSSERVEDVALPSDVTRKIKKVKEKSMESIDV